MFERLNKAILASVGRFCLGRTNLLTATVGHLYIQIRGFNFNSPASIYHRTDIRSAIGSKELGYPIPYNFYRSAQLTN